LDLGGLFDLEPEQGWESLLITLGTLAAAAVVGLLVHWLLHRVARRLAAATETSWDDHLVARLRGPAALLFPLLAVVWVRPGVRLPETAAGFLSRTLELAVIGTVAWMIAGVVLTVRDQILSRYPVDVEDNVRARGVHTQVRVFVRIAMVVITVVAVALMLTTFESVRRLGVSLLASAGIAGIIVGFAAQRSLGTLFAGIQIAITQPIRLDDVVIVEGEWGRIEEITLTYVVVRIWDERRLVVPIHWFLEKPFQNWTRPTAEILGTVYLWADYRIPVDEMREKLHGLLQESEHWDERVWNLQVTGASDRTVELRALMSAVDSSTAWTLRCEIREKLLAWLRDEHPDSLPRQRWEQEKGAGGGEE
jgi:small-conductance mechanosensitive channel